MYEHVQFTGDVILRGTEDETVAISWIYVDGPTDISGTFNTGDYQVTVDLQLSTGWNSAVFLQSDQSSVTLETGAEPAGTVWMLE